MALIKCKECNKQISDKAETCPKCGNPIKTKKTSNNKKKNQKNESKTFLIVIGSIIALIILIALISSGGKEYYCESEEHTLKGKTCFEKIEESTELIAYCKDGSDVMVRNSGDYCEGNYVDIPASYKTGCLEDNQVLEDGKCITTIEYDALEK